MIFLVQFGINKHLLIFQRPQIALALRACALLLVFEKFTRANHKNYNFPNCDWLKKLLFPTNSLVKLLSDSLLSDSLLSDSLLSDSSTNQSNCSLNQPITTLVSITIETVYKLLNLCILYQFFNVKFPFVT